MTAPVPPPTPSVTAADGHPGPDAPTALTDDDLAAIEALEAKATPAPWGFANDTTIVRGLEVTGRGSYRCISSVAEVTDEDDRELWDEHDDYMLVDPEHDGEFIVALRNAWPRLADALRAAREELHRAGIDNHCWRIAAEEVPELRNEVHNLRTERDEAREELERLRIGGHTDAQGQLIGCTEVNDEVALLRQDYAAASMQRDQAQAELAALRDKTAKWRDPEDPGEKRWSDAIDWLLNSRHCGDSDIQAAFWGMVDGQWDRETADLGYLGDRSLVELRNEFEEGADRG